MPNSGAFRSLHCLIYKVLVPSAQRRNIYYSITLSRTCQVLFSISFETFFPVLNSLSQAAQIALSLYRTRSLLSSPFFDFFRNLFPLPSCRTPVPLSSLAIITSSPRFVKPFLSLLQIFFSLPRSVLPYRLTAWLV